MFLLFKLGRPDVWAIGRPRPPNAVRTATASSRRRRRCSRSRSRGARGARSRRGTCGAASRSPRRRSATRTKRSRSDGVQAQRSAIQRMLALGAPIVPRRGPRLPHPAQGRIRGRRRDRCRTSAARSSRGWVRRRPPASGAARLKTIGRSDERKREVAERRGDEVGRRRPGRDGQHEGRRHEDRADGVLRDRRPPGGRRSNSSRSSSRLRRRCPTSSSRRSSRSELGSPPTEVFARVRPRAARGRVDRTGARARRRRTDATSS